MTEVRMVVPTSVERVFAVLSDGWTYASWVVGAAHIRAVDAGWPAPGARIHHSVGMWPAQVEDVTKVLAVSAPHSLELEARLWPFGAAHVVFELSADGPDSTVVLMREQAVKGPTALLPDAAQALFLLPRNKETLKRLADLAVHRETA